VEKYILKSVIAATLCGSLLVSCSPKEEVADETAAGFDNHYVISGTLQTEEDGGLSGTGIVRFDQNVASISSAKAMSLKAQLDSNLSAVTYVAHAHQLNLTDGVQVRFERHGANVKGFIKVNNESTREIAPLYLAQLLPNQLDLIIEVRNETASTRVLMWKNAPERTMGTVFFDSSVPVQMVTPLPAEGGTGVLFGLKMENAKVTRARLKDPL
jgi:hypothetical protein